MASTNKIDKIYNYIFEDEDARVCKDIPGEACTNVPGNFFKISGAQTLTKLADELANVKTVIPWLLASVGAPDFWIGLLVPIKESGSMLPQLFIADIVRRRPNRKPVWIVGALIQCLALIGIGVTPLLFRGPITGALIIALLILFSLARGLVSVASKDIVGKTIPKTRRGRLTGITAAISGFLTILTGALLFPYIVKNENIILYSGILFFAAGLWIIATALFTTVQETPGATSGGGKAVKEALARLAILKTDLPFRRFVLARALFLTTALAGPYYIVMAKQIGSGGEMLAVFILAGGIASAVSSLFWGKYADKSSKSVMILSVSIASLLGVMIFILDKVEILSAGYFWLIPAAYFILSIAHSGTRIGRKTYILDLAGGKKRIDYVAVGNTMIGLILLLSGSLSVFTPFIGISGMLLLFAILGIIGIVVATKLPEAQ